MLESKLQEKLAEYRSMSNEALLAEYASDTYWETEGYGDSLAEVLVTLPYLYSELLKRMGAK